MNTKPETFTVKPLTVYSVKVERTKTARQYFLVTRSDSNGEITLPRGNKLVYIVAELGSIKEAR